MFLPETKLPPGAFRGTHQWFLPALRLKLALLLVLMVVSWANSWLQMTCVRELADQFTRGKVTPQMWEWLGLFMASSAVVVLQAWLQPRLDARINAVGLQHLERELVRSLLRKDDAFFQQHPIGGILSRLGRDVIAAADRRLDLVRCVAAMGDVGVVLAFFIMRGQEGAGWVAAIAGGSALLGALWALTTFGAAARASEQCRGAQDAFQGYLEQILEARTEVRLAAAFDQAAAGLATPANERAMGYVAMAGAKARLDMIGNGGQLLTLGLFFYLGMSGYDKLNALLPVLLREVPRVFSRSNRFIELLARLAEGARALKRLEIYDVPPESLESAAKIAPPTVAEPLRVEGLVRRFSDTAGRPVGGIDDISFVIEPGTFNVVVGSAGCGKTTLIRVMAGLTRPAAGSIVMGRENLVDIGTERRAALLSFLPQFPTLLEGSIRDNLVFSSQPWAGPASEVELIEQTGLGLLAVQKALALKPSASAWKMWKGLQMAPQNPEAGEEARSSSMTLLQTGWGQTLTEQNLWILAKSIADGGRIGPSAALARAGRATFQSQQHLISLSEHEAYAALSPCPLTKEQWQVKRQFTPHVAAAQDETAPVWIAYALASTMEELAQALVETPAAIAAQAAAWSRACPSPSEMETRADSGPPASWLQALLPFAGPVEERAASETAAVCRWLETRPAVRHLLIDEGLGQPVGHGGLLLSGGQRQIVALTRVLRRGTPIVILDEPSSALDPEGKRRVASCLRQVCARRIILAVTHDEELVKAADHVVNLAHGQLASFSPGPRPDNS